VKVWITGCHGQLGYELTRTTPSDVVPLQTDAAQLDITDEMAVRRFVAEQRPNVVVNTAAYTAVDKAEQQPDLAARVNAQAPGYLAQALLTHCPSARLIHVSTDYVFAGDACRPYATDAVTGPLGVYGVTKLAGERAVLEALPGRSAVVRTAWLYSAYGHNFVKTMLKLMREREQLGVVADQIGTPTWANGLAHALWYCVANAQISGCLHWTDAGVASWYDFAVAIQEEGLRMGLLGREIPVLPICTQDYPTPAKRPAYSVLDKASTWAMLGQAAPHWRVALRGMMQELIEQGYG
jgi:dTDP-4-dehydrorhamnose reductase